VHGIKGCLILDLTGSIDTYNSTYFQKCIHKLVEAGFLQLIFNCSGLNYVSSTGIGSFTSFLKTLKPKGGDLVLLEVQPKVNEVFQLLGFSQFFPIEKTLEEAIGFFHGGGKKGNPALWKTC
jgi:anti-anti-sigma factor